MRVIIYALYHENECLYVGSTFYYETRIDAHLSGNGSPGSRNIPPGISWEPIVLDECDEEDRLAVEGEYIRNLEPKYNKIRYTTGEKKNVWVKSGLCYVVDLPGASTPERH
jgi:predicted GIY-YIG superfamily endonuclease